MLFDALIIGGSFSGISAAMQLARARRKVLVLDTGTPRNRFAKTSHGFFGHDGQTPREMLTEARRQLLKYESVHWLEEEAVDGHKDKEHFTVTTASGKKHLSKRLIIATGLSEDLPAIPGLQERWGNTVLHCPYCHGYEVFGQKLGVLAMNEGALQQANLVTDWGPVTLFTNGILKIDAALRYALNAKEIAIEEQAVRELVGNAPGLEGVKLQDGKVVKIAALFTTPPLQMTNAIAAQLGCFFEETPLGSIIKTNAQKETTVPGVYAAGDVARMGHNVAWAAADGVTAGIAAHQSLVAALM